MVNMNAYASSRPKKAIRTALAVFVGLGSLPYLIFGGSLLRSWIRVHLSPTYYVDYPYLGVGVGCVGLGLACLGFAIYSARRRSFYGLLYLIPGFLGLFAGVSIPNVQPHLYSRSADANYLADIGSYFRVWYEAHDAFPADEYEFAQAMAEGPAAWRENAASTPQSQYRRQGHALPYQELVFIGATGPRVDNASDRPGIIYYCVSADLQKFWATMTELDRDVAPSGTLKRVEIPSPGIQVVQAIGSDYPRDEKALREYREEVKKDPGSRHLVAETLNHLGVKYMKMQRTKEAEDAFTEALKGYRELAKTYPSWYSPDIASTLNSLGDLYSDTSRPKQAADSYTEALQIRRDLVTKHWDWYAPGLASTLNSLGSLCVKTQRLDEAVSAYTEALQIRRELVKANPTAYSPDLAATLNNLGALYKSEGRNGAAAQDCEEAAAIFRQLSVNNSGKYGPLLRSVCPAF
jgi:tetratricopeptide (TPR) repeat protein